MPLDPQTEPPPKRGIGAQTAELLIAALASGLSREGGPVDRDQATAFVLHLARALHLAGLPAYRLEEVLGRTAERLGLIAQFFSTPTSISVAFGPDERQNTHLLRVEPADVNLERLSDIDHVVSQVLEHRMKPVEGSRAIATILAAPPRYGPALTTLAFGVTSAAAAAILGGGFTEVGVAAAIGLCTGLLSLVLGSRPATARVFEFVAALVAALLAVAVTTVAPRYSVPNAILAGLIVLLPGFMLTTAMSELASRHLTAGTSRLSGALMVFLNLAFGVALGSTVGVAIFGDPHSAAPSPLPGWTIAGAIVAASLGFVVLLRAAPRDAPWIILAGALGVVGSRIGSSLLGAELGSSLGAFAVGVSGNLVARVRDRSALIMQAPGVLLLVPGSVGFQGLISMLDNEFIAGIDAAFRMIIIAISIVAGLLVANVVSPRRRIT